MNYSELYIVKELVDLVNIPSPSGFTDSIIVYLDSELKRLGFSPRRTRKGALVVEIGGRGNPIVLAAHVDTLGAMVKSLKPNGRLEITNVGGFTMNSIENENCIIHSKTGKTFSGTIQSISPSVHVFENARSLERKSQTWRYVSTKNSRTPKIYRSWESRQVILSLSILEQM